VAILPSYLIGSDATRGNLVRILSDYRLPQVEVNIGYPSRRHLPAKVRTFIDHLVDHFSQTPNGTLGELWLKDGRPVTEVGHAPEPEPMLEYDADELIDGDARSQTRASSAVPKLVRTARTRVSTPTPL
jgi:hypothetical protein